MVVKFLEQAKKALLALDPEYSTDIKDAIANLAKTLFRQGYPEDYFGEMLGNGSYKEAYKVSPHCVIKFCTYDNPTEEEENLYNAALNASFGHFFVPTFFFRLPIALPSSCFEEDENYCEDEFVLTDMEIQYIATTVDDLGLRYRSHNEEQTIVAGRAILSYTFIKKSRIDYDQWLKDAMTYYSYDKLIDFIENFIEYYGVTDLRSENIGYINGNQPVILDWMSSY